MASVDKNSSGKKTKRGKSSKSGTGGTGGKGTGAKPARVPDPAASKPAAKSKTVKRPTRSAAKSSKSADKPARPSRMRRLTRKMVLFGLSVLVLICLLPFILTLIYAPASVHPVSALMVANRISGQQVKRTWVPMENIAPVVYQAVISSEDGQYCSHGGVDWAAINLVVDDLMEGERPRGASTIPMQTVKNLYLWSSRSYLRKFLEVPLALYIDLIWSKRRTMEIYLNIAQWGPGIYGIEAAAQHHFKRSAKRLSRAQASLLAVTLPNPILRNPRKPNRGMRRLAKLVESRSRQSGAYVRCMR